MTIELGLALWLRYNQSLLEGVSGIPLIVADYDRLAVDLGLELERLLIKLGASISKKRILRQTGNFFSKNLNHAGRADIEAIDLPDEVASLYQELLVHASV